MLGKHAGPGAELVGYAHVGVGLAATTTLALSTKLGLGVCVAIGAATFVALSACMLHRVTVWVAAALGTLMAAGYLAALGYLLGHTIRSELAPPIVATIAALLGVALAANAYARFIRGLRAR